MEKETERIFRLLKILYPQYDMHSAYVGLQSDRSGRPRQRRRVHGLGAAAGSARADHPAVRSRRAGRRSAIATANRLLGSTLGDREEAIEVMALSEDPWLRVVRGLRDGRDAPDAVRREARSNGRTTPIRCCARPRSMRGRNCATPPPRPPASTRCRSDRSGTRIGSELTRRIDPGLSLIDGPIASAAGESGHFGTGRAT